MVEQRFLYSQEPYHKHSEFNQLKEERRKKYNRKFQKDKREMLILKIPKNINIIGCITHIHEDAPLPSPFSICIGCLNLIAINCTCVFTRGSILFGWSDSMFELTSSLITKYL